MASNGGSPQSRKAKLPHQHAESFSNSGSSGRRYARRSAPDTAAGKVAGAGSASEAGTPTSVPAGGGGLGSRRGSTSSTPRRSKSDLTEDTNNAQENIKVILLGDSGVGKTCLMVRFNNGTFDDGTSFISTVGIDLRTKVMKVDGKLCHLQVWDTAGQERFRSITEPYYRDADAILLVYDVTNQSTFDHLQSWFTSIKDKAPLDVSLLLVANKIDMSSQRQVCEQSGAGLAEANNCGVVEVSARAGTNVQLAFEAVAKAVVAKRLATGSTKHRSESTFDIGEYVNQNSQKSSCSC